MSGLAGRVALVTGASRGIGQAIALGLAGAGARVIGTATSDEGAAAIGRYLTEHGFEGRGIRLDVNDAERVLAVIDEIRTQVGAVEVLVNNAGITRDGLLMRLKDEDWDAVLSTNLKSVFLLTRAVTRDMMRARWGRVISISSVIGSAGNAGQSSYAAAKAGMEGFSRALARELGSRSVTVNCVAPGFTDTDMTRSLTPEQQNALLDQIPLGRLGTPEEIAAAVVFLASDLAAYITGTTLHVNGGAYMS